MYDPDQPRAPKGTEEGGQWVKASAAAREAAGLPQDTMQMYCDENGNWTEERQKLHEKIINDAFEGKTPVKNPKSIILGGGAGAGKTTVVKNYLNVDENTVYADADAIKYMLPEMKEAIDRGDPNASVYVHEESSYLSKVIAAKASKGNYNLLMDGTGDNSIDNLRKKVASLRDDNNFVDAVYVTVDSEIAWQRSLKRAEKTGRYVPKAVLFSSHKAVSKVFPEAVKEGLFDSFRVFDTSGPETKLIAKGKGTILEVLDEGAWLKFLKKGYE